MKKMVAMIVAGLFMASMAGVALADDSTAISKTSYAADSKTLTVVFEKNGTYEYAGVPAEVNEALEKAESKGTYFNENIRGKYANKKISD